MAFRVRVLPQWLCDIDSVNPQSDTKTDSKKSRVNKIQKKSVNVRDGNDNYTPTVKNEDENIPSTSGSAGERANNSKLDDQRKDTKLSPGKRVGRPARSRLEMNSSDEEGDVKPNLAELKNIDKNADAHVNRQTTLIPCVKKEDESKGTKLSPGKRVGRPARSRLEMSSSDEEGDVKPNLAELKEMDKNVDAHVNGQTTLVSCVKKEDESNDSPSREFVANSDPVIKRENVQVSLCNEQEIGGDERGVNGDVDPGGDAKPAVGSSVSPDTGDNVNVDLDTEGDAGAGSDAVANAGTDATDDAGSDANASGSTDAARAVNGTDNDQSSTTSNTTNNPNTIVRSKCKYGDQCYRKNPQHLQDFCHPGDSDYTTVDNRPECQYGLACYRKNPLHRQHYKHTKKVQKPRQAKRPRKKLVDDSSSDEDYDLDDPFIDDASSDDYQPSESGSETDLDAEEEDDGNDDSTQNDKNSKQLKRKRRH